MMIIDSFYFYLESKKYHPNGIDISKLMEYLSETGHRPKIKKWITSYNDTNIQGFYTWLKSWNGPQFEIIVKGTKEKRFICTSCQSVNYAIVEKGNDVEIASWILKGAYQNLYDTLLLVTGDGDFETPVRMAREVGKKVVIIGNQESVSVDIQCLATDFIELSKIKGMEKQFTH